ncbi:carnitine dehydratase [Mycobacterium malmoense]|uniref:CaiB/BaiF CoA transferase family protein n=1 Tax=Mycobacterium malmoense TaxID=1780 RepID=UPI00080BFF22|nr:CoA transferase [Mycobacterium malmoense]OCB24406.1 carnitine dehydratase [Mycobacterium malmoense]
MTRTKAARSESWDSPSALDGVLVADFSRVLAGPYMTMLLADLGATVIKVEAPSGDDTRQWGPPWHDGVSTYYKAINRNKRSVVLDLHNQDDRALARELAERADIMVENLKPGKMAGFGLGYDDVAPANDALVYCSISGFGSQPGGAHLPGYDLLGQAVGGLMSITGEADGRPLKVGVAVVDVLCGLHACVAVLAALQARNSTGRGQLVEVDLLSSVLSSLVNQASGYLLGGSLPGAAGNAHPSVAPYETFATADGNIVIAVGSDRQFATLCDALKLESLTVDPLFTSNAARVANRHALVARINDRLATMRREAALELLGHAGVPSGPVNNVAEAFEFAKSVGLEPTWTCNGDRYVRPPFRLHGTPPSLHRHAPALDDAGNEVREWLRQKQTGRTP